MAMTEVGRDGDGKQRNRTSAFQIPCMASSNYFCEREVLACMKNQNRKLLLNKYAVIENIQKHCYSIKYTKNSIAHYTLSPVNVFRFGIPPCHKEILLKFENC